MDGYLTKISPKEKSKKWRERFFKIDGISCRLIYYKDNTLVEQKGSLMLNGSNIYIPLPDDINYGIDISKYPFTFVIQEPIGFNDQIFFLNAKTDDNRKKWLKSLYKISNIGPQNPTFNNKTKNNNTSPEFSFLARVTEYHIHEKGHVEYKVKCCCRLLNRLTGRSTSKEWDTWHRFSDFADLDSALRDELGFQMKDIHFLPRKREAFRSILGNKLDPTFLEFRRSGLDIYISQICSITIAVDFLKHHSNDKLKRFFEFEKEYQLKEENDRTTRNRASSDVIHKDKNNIKENNTRDRSVSCTVETTKKDNNNIKSNKKTVKKRGSKREVSNNDNHLKIMEDVQIKDDIIQANKLEMDHNDIETNVNIHVDENIVTFISNKPSQIEKPNINNLFVPPPSVPPPPPPLPPPSSSLSPPQPKSSLTNTPVQKISFVDKENNRINLLAQIQQGKKLNSISKDTIHIVDKNEIIPKKNINNERNNQIYKKDLNNLKQENNKNIENKNNNNSNVINDIKDPVKSEKIKSNYENLFSPPKTNSNSITKNINESVNVNVNRNVNVNGSGNVTDNKIEEKKSLSLQDVLINKAKSMHLNKINHDSDSDDDAWN